MNIKIKKELLAELQNSSLNPDPDPNLAAKQSIENKHSCAQTKKRLSKNVFRITDGSIKFEETVSVISSDPPCKNEKAYFTTMTV